jgi:hypothetical protein
MRSGKPFNITSGTDDNADGDNNDRPSITPGKVPHLLPYQRVLPNSPSKPLWFDTSAYCKTGSAGCVGTGPGNADGTVRPNSLTAPGYRDVDASIFRDFTIHERVKFQFRGEATNVFNMVNLAAPGGTLSSPASFGVISSGVSFPSGTGMRVIQLGGRLLF